MSQINKDLLPVQDYGPWDKGYDWIVIKHCARVLQKLRNGEMCVGWNFTPEANAAMPDFTHDQRQQAIELMYVGGYQVQLISDEEWNLYMCIRGTIDDPSKFYQPRTFGHGRTMYQAALTTRWLCNHVCPEMTMVTPNGQIVKEGGM